MDILINGTAFDINVEIIDASRVIYSDFRGWMSPDGELHSLQGVDGHRKLAEQFLGVKTKDPIKALQDAGWIRIVARNSFSCGKMTGDTKRLLLSIVLRQRDCDRFFIETDGKVLNGILRDKAIEYFSE